MRSTRSPADEGMSIFSICGSGGARRNAPRGLHHIRFHPYVFADVVEVFLPVFDVLTGHRAFAQGLHHLRSVEKLDVLALKLYIDAEREPQFSLRFVGGVTRLIEHGDADGSHGAHVRGVVVLGFMVPMGDGDIDERSRFRYAPHLFPDREVRFRRLPQMLQHVLETYLVDGVLLPWPRRRFQIDKHVRRTLRHDVDVQVSRIFLGSASEIEA